MKRLLIAAMLAVLGAPAFAALEPARAPDAKPQLVAEAATATFEDVRVAFSESIVIARINLDSGAFDVGLTAIVDPGGGTYTMYEAGFTFMANDTASDNFDRTYTAMSDDATRVKETSSACTKRVGETNGARYEDGLIGDFDLGERADPHLVQVQVAMRLAKMQQNSVMKV